MGDVLLLKFLDNTQKILVLEQPTLKETSLGHNFNSIINNIGNCRVSTKFLGDNRLSDEKRP